MYLYCSDVRWSLVLSLALNLVKPWIFIIFLGFSFKTKNYLPAVLKRFCKRPCRCRVTVNPPRLFKEFGRTAQHALGLKTIWLVNESILPPVRSVIVDVVEAASGWHVTDRTYSRDSIDRDAVAMSEWRRAYRFSDWRSNVVQQCSLLLVAASFSRISASLRVSGARLFSVQFCTNCAVVNEIMWSYLTMHRTNRLGFIGLRLVVC